MILLFLFFKTFAYRLKDEDVTVVNGVITNCTYDISTKGNVIEIPDVLDGQTITGIGNYAFSVAGKIAVLKLPSTLKMIGNGVFEGHALTELVIPDGVTSIGSRAFYGNALSSINLPAGLVSIGDGTFGNNQLTNITLPDGLISIGYDAFSNNKIVSLTIPNSLETIENSAFYNNRITSLTIPNNLTAIGSSAFSNNNISTLNFQSGCQLQEISSRCFYSNDIKNVIIPAGVQNIYDYAFGNNTNLTSVTFEANSNLLRIRRGAFSSCNLSSVSLPGSLIFIGRYAFGDNNNLSNFKLPTSTNNYKWNDSNGETYDEGDQVSEKYYSYVAIIPYTLKDEDVTVVDGIITDCNYFNDAANVASVITIPENLNGQDIVGIGGSVFSDRGISEIILPDGIVDIDSWAFARNEIINLSLPNSLETIGTQAFYDNCINSLSFESTSSLEVIGIEAFFANRLTNIDFPKSIIKIEKDAFVSNLLQDISFEENSQLLSIGSGAFTGNRELQNQGFTLPDPTINGYNHWVDWDNNNYSSNLDVINFESFYKIPIEYTLTDNDVEVIDGVIVSCTLSNPNANILIIPDILDGQEIIGIGDDVFITMGLIGVNLPSTLKFIEYSAFTENEIINITIPANVEEIKGSAFARNNINELIFDGNSRLRQIGRSAFSQNKISSIVLPDSLNNIGSYAFAWNNISSGITIPDSVESIDWRAFWNNQIPELVFGENSLLSYLGDYAFAYNNISNEIFIPTSLTEISDYAFLSNNISEVITHSGIVEYGNGAFQNNNQSLKIVLHEPPTIPFITHFFGWKDNEGVYHYDGEEILDFSDRYKAVIDQYFVVKFIVEDDNDVPVENASIQFYDNVLMTDVNGIDSIGPVLRGLQNYEVSAEGCYESNGSVDVQDDMTVHVTLIRYFNVDINIVDINNNPIQDAMLVVNNSTLTSGTTGNVKISLPDGNYPFIINATGYKEYPSSFTVHDSDTTLNITLYRVTVNYYPNGGMGAAFTDTTYANIYAIKTNVFARTAYTFSHWNIKADDSDVSYAENDNITLEYSDIDLYAIWKPVDYNITYHLNGGTNDSGNPTVYNIESEIDFLPANKTSLYFATWIDADSNRVSRIDKGNSGDIELWAVFTTEPTYYIDYYNLENASHDNQSIYTRFDLPFMFTGANKTGYEFIGWYEDSLFTKQITTIPEGSTSNYDVYAKWGDAIIYAITYNLDGGENNPVNPSSYTIESDTIIFEPPTKTGARFIGWYNDIFRFDDIKEIPQGSVGDTTIYAKWELDTFNIHYILNGGNNNLANPAQYNVESNTIILENPDKEGHIFDGWYTDSLYSSGINSIPSGSVGDVTVYAKWIELFEVHFIITTDGINPAKDVDIVIDNTHKFKSDVLGLADTLMPDGSTMEYSVAIDSIVIENGSVTVSGDDITIKVEIVDCYMRWYDVIFCDNGKGMWIDFVWYNDNTTISTEQFYHKPGGIEDGKYRLAVTSITGVKYIWEKEYETDKFWGIEYSSDKYWEEETIAADMEIKAFPNPVLQGSTLNLVLSKNIDLQTASIFIYSVNGVLVKKINNLLYTNRININNNFSSGCYYVIFLDAINKRRSVIDFIVD